MLRVLLGVGLLGIFSLACQQPPTDEAAPSEPVTASGGSQVSDTSQETVEYEPAYPDDVSSEELSESDVAQQEPHSHGDGEEHSHEDGDHHHGEEEHQDEHDH